MTTSNSEPLPTETSPYVERWEQALRVLLGMDEHERTKHFDMSDWGHRTDCGTVACLAGHCSLDPWFRERGFHGEFNAGGYLIFPSQRPITFFGERGNDKIFTGPFIKWEHVVAAVREHIDYLKKGGNPDETRDITDEIPF